MKNHTYRITIQLVAVLLLVCNLLWASPLDRNRFKHIPNLTPPQWKPEMPLVPKGIGNVALGKPVTTSVAPIIGTLDQVTDGRKDGTDDQLVELATGLQWFQIDLLEQYEIYAIVAWHYRLQFRVYYDVIIQISDDPEFEKDVKTVFNNDFDNSSGFGVGKDLSFIEPEDDPPLAVVKPTVRGRYVRLYSRGNTSPINANNMIEVEVFGCKPPSAEPEHNGVEPLKITIPRRLFA